MNNLNIFQHFLFLLLRILSSVLLPIFNRVICCFGGYFLEILHTLKISPLSDVGLVKIFSQSVGCHLVLSTVSFALQKLHSLKRSHLLIVDLSVSSTNRSWVRATFSSDMFSVAIFILRCLIHFELSFVQGYKDGST